jgi:hypothetical protein
MWILPLAGAAGGGRAARAAHQLDNVGNGGVAQGREHAGDKLRCDECARDDLNVNQAWEQVWVCAYDIGKGDFRWQDIPCERDGIRRVRETSN